MRKYIKGLINAAHSIGIGLLVLPLCLDLALRAVADIGVSLFDESMCKFEHLFEVVAGEGDAIWGVAEPFNIFLYFFYELVCFFVGIGIVIAEEAASSHPAS